jgi:hypothetical protein
MERVHVGMLIMVGGAALLGLAGAASRSSDRRAAVRRTAPEGPGRPPVPGAEAAEGDHALAVTSILLVLLGGIGVAVSSAVFP